MSIDPGAVHLRITLSGQAPCTVAEAQVVCRRPAAAQVLRGKTPDAAATLAPLLFAVCGKAQGLAARLALGAARGEAVADHRDAGAAQEAAREHLWHLLGEGDPKRLMEGTRRLQQPAQLAEFLAPLLGMAAATWQALDGTALLRWVADKPAPLALALEQATLEINAPAVPLLPALDAATSLVPWPRLDDAFAARPHWQGEPAETGALARRQGDAALMPLARQPLLQRRLARLRELVAYALEDETVFPAPGRASAHALAPGRGRALVETARGLLMHEVEVAGDRVTDYVIVAPTEWNFHPQGNLPRWAKGLAVTLEQPLAQSAAALVAALDPCVVWRLEQD